MGMFNIRNESRIKMLKLFIDMKLYPPFTVFYVITKANVKIIYSNIKYIVSFLNSNDIHI